MEIVIALDTYDDLFSDFDIRSFHERPFSRDFLDELNLRMIKSESNEDVRISLLMPAGDRDRKDEQVILDRMVAFFAERYKSYIRKDRKTKLQALVFVLVGLVFLLLANFLSRYVTAMWNDFLLIPSWYFVWSGLERFVESREPVRGKQRYYGSLSKAAIEFKDREAY